MPALSALAIVAVLVVAGSVTPAVHAEVIEVCVTGDVMDVYCVQRGTLLDNPGVRTLASPEEHTVHCLVDVSFCWQSGFEILTDPVNGGTDHCRAVVLDTAGRDLALSAARASTSHCSTCTGPSSGARKGYKATVKGTIDTSSNAIPPVLTTTSVEPASVGCPGGATVLSHCAPVEEPEEQEGEEEEQGQTTTDDSGSGNGNESGGGDGTGEGGSGGNGDGGGSSGTSDDTGNSDDTGSGSGNSSSDEGGANGDISGQEQGGEQQEDDSANALTGSIVMMACAAIAAAYARVIA